MSRRVAREALSKLIDDNLLHLSRKYKVPKPHWRYTIFRKTDRRWAAVFDDIANIILVGKKTIRFYEAMPEDAGAFMKFVIAHEFYHYLNFLGSGLAERGLPKRIREAIGRWSMRAFEEEAAVDFAENETGYPALTMWFAQIAFQVA